MSTRNKKDHPKHRRLHQTQANGLSLNIEILTQSVQAEKELEKKSEEIKSALETLQSVATYLANSNLEKCTFDTGLFDITEIVHAIEILDRESNTLLQMYA